MPIWTYEDWKTMLEDHPDLFYPKGFEHCIMGIIVQADGTAAILLDEDRIIDTLEENGMSRYEAWEFYEHKIKGSRMKNGPAYMVDTLEEYGDEM